ncbi:uncharacterized protein RJT20DRAFT_100882 [Scheffersomyces xylosifermentans]|uniref:uncharacterized protein n=1 Tax=Scheffersomyces xylosifermentans TaxID=1304137 RepID=UPI00315C6789
MRSLSLAKRYSPFSGANFATKRYLTHGKGKDLKKRWDASTYEFMKTERKHDITGVDLSENSANQYNSEGSKLPFDKRRNSETFGQLVRSDHLKKQDQLIDNHEKYIKSGPTGEEDGFQQEMSPFRNPDGSFIKGETAEEARLHDLTLEGRVDKSITRLPDEIAKTINNNILRLTIPDKLRERAASIYQSLGKDQIQKAPETSLDCDAHIAALFLQDYSHARQVLLELQKRVGKENFNPQKILDVGYGPATGIVALNEIMGDDWVPQEKESYIVGRRNHQMKKRAKLILSRQLNENFSEVEVDVTGENEATAEATASSVDIIAESEVGVAESSKMFEEAEEVQEEIEEAEQIDEDQLEEGEYVGPINTSAIKIRTRLRDTLPVTKSYDLIMVNHALLTREFQFPKDIDDNMEMVLRLLKPGGHLVLIERGNAVGFETIARARQIMIRPESHTGEVGKIPRPYIRGATKKPQRLRKEDQIISEEDIEYEKELLQKYELEDFNEEEEEELQRLASSELEDGSEFEKELIEKYGEPTEEDLKFEVEGSEDYDVLPVDQESVVSQSELSSESVDYHISIIAPCPHHRKCPLQIGDPKYYKIPSHTHRLNFCSFNKVVERPKYTMELKKGRRLATTWDKTSEDGFGLDRLSKKTLQKLEGSGRPGGNNSENGSYSYLIAQRSLNDVETIKKIDSDRAYNNYDASNELDPNNWARIIQSPAKIKKNVKLTVCAASGNVELWQIPRSVGKQEYHDARKVERGDLWALGKKSVIVKNQISDKIKEKLDVLSKTQKKTFLKEQRKKQWKKKISASEDAFFDDVYQIADTLATDLENSKNYQRKGRRANYDVDPRSFDGN